MASVKRPEIATLKTIEDSLKLIDTKKENLKKAYDHLQAHSSLLSSSFSLSWSDLDAHFTSVQRDLTHRFQLLQSLQSSPNKLPASHEPVESVATGHELGVSNQSQTVLNGDPSSSSNPPIHDQAHTAVAPSEVKSSPGQSRLVRVQDPSSSNSAATYHEINSTTQSQAEAQGVAMQDPLSSSNPPSKPPISPVVTAAELIPLCEKMDGKGLRSYVDKNANCRDMIRAQLGVAMRVAADPATMVLDAMEGFYSSDLNSKGDKDQGLHRLRKSCLDLLEVLTEIKPNLSGEVRERAKVLALEWKERANLTGESTSEPLGFLNLVVAYGLENEFDSDELVDHFVVTARFKQATVLCRAIGLGERISDLIQRLIDDNKPLLAIKFIFEFGMTDKFQPVPLLNAYLKESKSLAKKVYADKKNSIKAQNEARSREISALKSVLKVIDENKLDSMLPRVNLQKRIDMLEKQKADSKNLVPSSINMPQQQPKKQQQQPKQKARKKQQKRQRQQQQHHQHSGNKRPRTTGPAGPALSTIPPFQQSHLHPAGLLHAAGPYGLVGSTPPIVPYAGSLVRTHGLAGAPMGFAGTASPAGTHLQSSEAHMPPGFYDRPAAYGAHGLSLQYHPSYYPQ